jgi:L-threonylcarbamoyladenylate synthase
MPAEIIPADLPALARAAAILHRGGLVVIPTETVYGLAADATNPEAVARIFAAKGRPNFNPLIAHVTGRDTAAQQARLSIAARKLIDAFWPGPLTIVARKRGDVCDLACAGLDTIALRAPSHPIARQLLALLPFPLAAPSANISGHVSPTTAQHAAEELGDKVDLILDGGPCAIGVESTIVAAPSDLPPTILRAGGITAEAIERIVGPVQRAKAGDAVSAPGMMARHYAPRAKLRLNAAAPEPGETYLGFGPGPGAREITLSETGNVAEAAARLYAMLRDLDATGVEAIAIAPIPETGLGEAINDRLRRAAEGR